MRNLWNREDSGKRFARISAFAAKFQSRTLEHLLSLVSQAACTAVAVYLESPVSRSTGLVLAELVIPRSKIIQFIISGDFN